MSRQFIANVDEANNEIVRLDQVVATNTTTITALTGERDTAKADLAAAQAEVTRLKAEATTAATAKAEAETKLTAEQTAHTATKGELAAEKTKASKIIAKAGVKPRAESGQDDENPSAGLTGLQRAMAANCHAQGKEFIPMGGSAKKLTTNADAE